MFLFLGLHHPRISQPRSTLLLGSAGTDCLSNPIDYYLGILYCFFFFLNENEGINIPLILIVISLKVKYDGI